MNNNKKIYFVRMYNMYNKNWYDVIYHSGRVVTYIEPNIPNTVNTFVKNATGQKERYDSIFKRHEMIYTA